MSGTRPPNGPLLVATMIVRNEELMLPDCLASLAGIVSEVIVCDTGSTDGTIEVARAAGARVIEREWRDDFGWARTEVLNEARHARFILSIDADERVVCDDPVALHAELEKHSQHYDAFMVRIDNLQLSGRTQSTFEALRVLNPDVYYWHGALHEQATLRTPTDLTRWTTLHGLRLDHLGYDAAMMRERDKGERNLRIARESYEKESTAVRGLQYARTLRIENLDRPLQRELYQRFIDETGPRPAIAAELLGVMAAYDFEDGDYEAAMDRAAAALRLVPADGMAALVFAKAADKLGRHAVAADVARRRRTAVSPDPLYDMPENKARALAWESLARARTGDLDGAMEDAAAALDLMDGSFEVWAALGQAVFEQAPDRAAELLAPLVARDAERGIQSMVRCIPPAVTAELAARMVEDDAATADVVSTGMLAAAISRDAERFDRMLPAATLLQRPALERVAAKAAERGLSEQAAFLAGLIERRDATEIVREPLRLLLPKTVLFLEQAHADDSVPKSVEACASALGEAGWTPVRHITERDEEFVQARLPEGTLPMADARGIIEALSPDLVVFCSVARFQRDYPGIIGHPETRVALLVPVTPTDVSTAVDAVLRPGAPDTIDTVLHLAATPPEPIKAKIPMIPAVSVVSGLTSVIIPVWNQWALTEACLDALAASTSQPLEIIVVDNGSTDETPQRLGARSDVRVITNAENLGFAPACNQGLAASTGEFVCLLNNDTEVTPGWLEALLTALSAAGTGLVGPRTNRISGLQAVPAAPSLADRAEAHGWAREWSASRPDAAWQTHRLVGFCVLGRRALFERLGGLDEAVGMGNFEDDELCDRVRAAGLTLRVADRSVVLHHLSATFRGQKVTYAATMRRGARHFMRIRHQDNPVLVTALVLSDGQPAEARRTLSSALGLADRVIVLERGDLTPTELAVAGTQAGLVTAAALDWAAGVGLGELLSRIAARQVLVLAAGEQLETQNLADARSEIERLPIGPLHVRVGEELVARLHPPTPDAPDVIGSRIDGAPAVHSFWIVPPP